MQGLILINKPSGITSFGAVARIKRLASQKRVGHTGTLDPMATGVLPIFLGRATSLCSYLLDADKEYIATVRLGLTTDSCDITGSVTGESAVAVSNAELLAVINSFIGRQLQIPPMFSALKKDGVRLYELARKGESVDIPPRNIEVYSAELVSGLNADNEFSVRFRVSKGTYIRSLCRDIGEKLGCGAVLTALCRTSASGFDISQCVELDSLTPENISEYIISEDAGVSYMPEIFVSDKQAVRFSNGGQLDFERVRLHNPKSGELFRVKFGETLLGLGIADCEKGQLAVKCVINNEF